MDEIIEIAFNWEMNGEVSPDDAMQIYERLIPYLDHVFDRINRYIEEDDPQEGLSTLVSMTNFLSAAGVKVPGIITKLQKTIKKYQGHAISLGKKLGADSVSISVGFPSGVSVTLTWNI